MDSNQHHPDELPIIAKQYIDSIISKMKYRDKIRLEVKEELENHFIDALSDYISQKDKDMLAEELINEFGDSHQLAQLIRRSKKRCRPWWKKSLIHSFQAFGIFIILLYTYVAWLNSGTPTITHDYLAQMNQLMTPAIESNNNAKQYYDKAFSTYVGLDDIIKDSLKINAVRNTINKIIRFNYEPSNIEHKKLIEQWIAANEDSYLHFKQASKYPFYDQPYIARQNNSLYDLPLIDLYIFRNLSKIASIKAHDSIKNNQYSQGQQHCFIIANSANHLKNRLLFVEQLVYSGMNNYFLSTLISLAKHGNLSNEQIDEIILKINSLYPNGINKINLEGERLIFLDGLQRNFTKGGPNGGHLINTNDLEKSLSPYFDSKSRSIDSILATMLFPREFMRSYPHLLHAGRNETIKKADIIFEQYEEYIKLSPYEYHKKNLDDIDLLFQLPFHRFQFLYSYIPTLSGASLIPHRQEAFLEATLTILALKKWHNTYDSYPNTLNELVLKGYLKKLPKDPYTANDSLKYRNHGNDFILYSIGGDFEDDGGIQYTNDPWARFYKDGDRVFWPTGNLKVADRSQSSPNK